MIAVAAVILQIESSGWVGRRAGAGPARGAACAKG